MEATVQLFPFGDLALLQRKKEDAIEQATSPQVCLGGIPPILGLPVEILLCITDRLLNVDATALLISCKALHVLFKSRRSTWVPGPRLMAERLERDMGASYYFCSISGKLRRPDRLVAKLVSPAKGEVARPRNRTKPDSFILNFDLFHHQVRMVMNRHLYGNPAGLPLDTLNRIVTYIESLPPGEPEWMTEYTGRIRKNKLVIRGKHMLLNRAPTVENSWQNVTSLEHYICPHQRLRTLLQLKNLFNDWFYSCTLCPTDYYFCKQPNRMGNTDCIIYSFHLVGRGRKSESWKWRCLTGQDSLHIRKDPHIYCPNGMAMDHWYGKMFSAILRS